MKLKKKIKKAIKSLIPKSLKEYKNHIREMQGRHQSSLFTAVKKTHIYKVNSKLQPCDDYVRQMGKMLTKMDVDTSLFYIYPYDSWHQRLIPAGRYTIVSITVDYDKVLDSSLDNLIHDLSDCANTAFKQNELKMIDAIRKLANRIKKELNRKNDSRSKELQGYLDHMLANKPSTFDEALQKILFYNGLLWQANHWHNGLGRLDLILSKYYDADVKSGLITRDRAKEMLRQFVLTLGKDTRSKSCVLVGDTGQYILLGGVDQNGNTVQNDLTEIFLELFTELNIPDPKLILRANEHTSETIWEKAVDCITTGCGSPLLMNEDVVMRNMIEFGYKKEDVWNVGTSACWEPLIIGKSFDQNNPLPNVPVLQSINELFASDETFDNMQSVIERVKQNIAKQIEDIIHDIQFDSSPLYSLFFDSCIEREKDYTSGGADYAYHGVEIVSFPNLINALLNIRKYIFEERVVTWEECRNALKANFEGFDDLRLMLKSNNLKFGNTDKTVVDLSNDLMKFIGDEVKKYTCNGEKLKVGFSSSQYIMARWQITASLDGRQDYEPFAVHISPVNQKIDIQEVIDFASTLNYSGNRINGNVVDFIVPTSFVKNKDKLVTILRNAIKSGVFEMQLNVLDAATLRDAKAHPEKYPDLVVRVWGFSTYFNDLPEEYKDNLIARAAAYE